MTPGTAIRLMSGIALAALVLCASPSTLPSHSSFSGPRPVSVRFIKSALADYLLYLFHRGTGGGRFGKIVEHVTLADVPTLNELISLPGVAASVGATSYADIKPLLEPYRSARERILEVKTNGETRYRILGYGETLPDFDVLTRLVAAGEPHYDAFRTFWEGNIAPVEQQKIEEWQRQFLASQPIDSLQRVARLPFPFDQLDVVAMGLHGSGSANSDPPGIYTGLGVRNIAWAIGHEGTHLLVDRHAGANWFARPQATEAIRLVTDAGGHPNDIEEALCLLMQARLSAAAGFTPIEHRVSVVFTEPSPKRAILVALEEGWESYSQSTKGDLIDFMLDRAIHALSKR
jgi:hypothetical protein